MNTQSSPEESPNEPVSPEELRRTLNESAQLLTQNRPGEAVEKLLPLHGALPDHPDVAINLGGAYILQRKWDKAVDILEDTAEKHPGNAMVWTNLAAAYLGRLELSGPKQQERAIFAYQRALQADPQAPNVHYHLGLLYKERNELMRASAFFQRALEVNPADRDARRWLRRMDAALAERHEQETQQRADDESAQAPDSSGGASAEEIPPAEASDPDRDSNTENRE